MEAEAAVSAAVEAAEAEPAEGFKEHPGISDCRVFACAKEKRI